MTSAFMSRLLAGSGLLLATVLTSGAFLTEITFRGYALTRLQELFGGCAGMCAFGGNLEAVLLPAEVGGL